MIVDRYESYLAEMLASLGNALTYDLIVPVVVDIERIDIIEQVFENYRPEIIFMRT